MDILGGEQCFADSAETMDCGYPYSWQRFAVRQQLMQLTNDPIAAGEIQVGRWDILKKQKTTRRNAGVHISGGALLY